MNHPFGAIARCIDLQESHVVAAMAGRAETRALLGHLASISRPNTGAAKALLVYARLATTACDWIDGDLSVDLVEDHGHTLIEAATELGGGMRERLFPALTFDTPLDEFARAIARVPHLIAPLNARSMTARRIRLSALEMVRRTTAPPPPFAIASESLFVAPPAAVPKEASDSYEVDLLPLPVIAAPPRGAPKGQPAARTPAPRDVADVMQLPVITAPRKGESGAARPPAAAPPEPPAATGGSSPPDPPAAAGGASPPEPPAATGGSPSEPTGIAGEQEGAATDPGLSELDSAWDD